MSENLLRALVPLCAEQGREIEVLVPAEGTCPVRAPGLRETVLPRFGRRKLLWDQWTVPSYANKKDCAVLYNPNLLVPQFLQIPGFATVHDFMYFPQPQKYAFREYAFADALYFRLLLPKSLRRSARTHLVSQASMADARQLFPKIPSSKYCVIPHGIDAAYWAEHSTQDTFRFTGRYVLYVGALSRRKNAATLLRAFRSFAARHSEYSLVIVSGSRFPPDPAIAPLLRQIPADRVRILRDVEKEELRSWYRHAAFFVYPSLYEGFGIPVLEAQAASCPVLCSSATSLPEVAGNAALFFDPHSPEELEHQMERLTEESERRRLMEEGKRNCERFSWDETARRFLALADEVYALSHG